MSSVEESIIATQRSIITIQDELNATNDSIIELLKVDNTRLTKELDTLHKEWKNLLDYRVLSDKDNARLTEENAMMRTKLAPYLAQEEEDRAENAIDLEQYMGYTKPRTGTFVPYPKDINGTKEV